MNFPNLSFMCAFLVVMHKITPEEADLLHKELSTKIVKADWRFIIAEVEQILKRSIW